MSKPSPRPLTVGALVQRERGVNLVCLCGHKTALLPEQLERLAHPETRLLDFKRRSRCSMCGRSGDSEDIRMTTFALAPILKPAPRRPRVQH
jgi:hypothetical protein